MSTQLHASVLVGCDRRVCGRIAGKMRVKGRERRGGEGRRAEEMKGEGEISVYCTLKFPGHSH